MLAQPNPSQKAARAFMQQEHAPLEKAEESLTITSRFGEVTVSLKNAIAFPQGLLGLPQFKSYCLATMPNPKLGHFKLLQSLDDTELSFAVLPIEPENALIDAADIEECCKVNGVERQNLGLLLVVSVQRQVTGGNKITVNLRAPIVVDTDRKLALQYVFPHNKYQIAYELN
jgi:flagellar assembly factor FliW